MDNLIPVINKLQDVFNRVGNGKSAQLPVDLPQIVVIGSQSSGKSSVLENIVGRGFLPRGPGICTRRPLVLQLYNLKKGEQEYAEFLHVPNRKFVDFDEVRREIEIETDRVTGRNKGISNKAIRLSVYSPNVVNLTLVDLPGITKVPIGDQPMDIENLIRDMCMEYITNPLCIILAVSPANVDLANSDALKLAREVDPNGDRTIGILTKLDLVDKGVDALDALNGKIIPLKKYGFIGVLNRNQQQINNHIPLGEVRKNERAFFLNHPSYRAIANKQGTEVLTKKLNQILLQHIREHLPELKSNIQKQLRDVERELAMLGTEVVSASDKTAQGQLILSLLSQYSTQFVDSMEGRQRPSALRATESGFQGGLYGGAKLARSFKTFSERLDCISPFRDLSDSDIGTAILNATGPRPSLFVPEMSFEILVKRQLAYLQEPAISCLMDVYEVLSEVAEQSCFRGLARFGALQESVLENVSGILSKSLKPTQDMIENLIKVEQAFINTSHPDFTCQLQSIRTRNDSFFDGSGGLPPSQSAVSLSSAVSEPSGMNTKRYTPSGSVDYDAVNEVLEANGSSEVNSEDDENASPNGNSAPKGLRPSFMSLLFQERVNGTSTSSTSALAAAAAVQNHYSSSSSSSASGMMLPPVAPRLSKMTGASGILEETESDTQVRIIKRLIESYLSISKKNVLDLTPKTIMHFLVNRVKENIHTELIRSLYKEDLFDSLLQEDEQVAQTREQYKQTCDMLRQALEVLHEVREFKLR